MDGTDKKLQHNKENPLKGHGDPPIICSIVDHEELEKANNVLQLSTY